MSDAEPSKEDLMEGIESADDQVQSDPAPEQAPTAVEERAAPKHIFSTLFGESDDEEEEEDVPERPWGNNHDATPAASSNHEAPTESRPLAVSNDEARPQASDDFQDGENEDAMDSMTMGPIPIEPISLEGGILTSMPYNPPDHDATLSTLKPPLSLSFQPVPFDSDTWDAEDLKPEIEIDEAGRKHLKRKIFDMVRWRYRKNPDGSKSHERESNSRLVTFSDGSRFLFVGKEAYEVRQMDQRNFHHLFVRQMPDPSTPSFLQCHGEMPSKLILVPSNLHKVHNLGLKTRMKTMTRNKARSQIVTGGKTDPLHDKLAKERIEENQNLLRNEYATPARARKLTPGFLEDSDEDVLEPVDVLRSRRNAKENAEQVLAAKEELIDSDELLLDEDLQLDEDEELFQDFDDDADEPKSKKSKV